MESKKYKYLLAFVLLSLSILLVYDLFFEAEMRQEVTSDRNFPRIYRSILLLIYSFYLVVLKTGVKTKFNGLFKAIYCLIIFNIILRSDLSISVLISLSKVLLFFFTYLFFYRVFSIMPLTSKKYVKKFVLFSIISLSSYIVISRIGITSGLITSGLTKIYGDNNAYILLSFLPFIFSLNFKRQNILLFILIIAIFFSLKRGAILALIFALIPLIFNINRAKINIIPKLIKNLLFFIVSFFMISYALDNFQEIINERTLDLSFENQEELGSGRGLMYLYMYDDFLNSSNFFTLLFGFGYESVQELLNKKIGTALMAHSDILNFMHSYGLFGLSLLSWFILHQRKIVSRLFKAKSQYFIPYYMIFIIFLLKALYSGNFEQMNFSYLLICYALLNVLVANQKIRI